MKLASKLAATLLSLGKNSLSYLVLAITVSMAWVGPGFGTPVDRPAAVDEMAPYLWGVTAPAPSAPLQSLTTDPLLAGMQMLAALEDHQPAEVVAARLSHILSLRSPSGHWPHPRYNDFPDGWWSAMDYAAVGLAAVRLFQQTKDPSHREIFRQLTAAMLKPPKQHGNLWTLPSGNCWLSEYSWDGQNLIDEWYILNGNLLALQSLLYASKEFGEPFSKAYECAREGLSELSDKFRYQNRSWFYYGLKPPIENQGHYVIYETMQFDSLFFLTGDTLYKQMSDERRAILAKAFRPLIADGKLFFSRLGPPHPYVIDIYLTSISIENDAGEVIKTFDIRDQFFLTELPQDASWVVVKSRSGKRSFLISRTRVDDIEKVSGGSETKVEVSVSANFDAALVGDRIEIRPEVASADPDGSYAYLNHQARITIQPSPLIDRESTFLFAIELEQDSSESMSLHVLDDKESSAWRVIPDLGAGRTLMLVATQGLRGSGNFGQWLRSFTISIDTNPQQTKRFTKINAVHAFKNGYDLYQYLQETGIRPVMTE